MLKKYCYCHKRLAQNSLLLLPTPVPKNWPEQNFSDSRQTNIWWICLAPDMRLLPFQISNVGARNIWKSPCMYRKYCRTSRYGNKISNRSVLNKLEVQDLTKSLKQLYSFETILIQKDKCFQTIVWLGTIQNKLVHSEILRSVKGHVVYCEGL